jgi:aarF domain-containing kinase
VCFQVQDLCILCSVPCPGAAVLGAIDYKKTFARTYESDDERMEAYSQCHTRSAKRVLKALLANGGASAYPYHCSELDQRLFAGVFIKMGQHMASL